ncbi:MAG TPA: hypothetical protein VMW27_24655 [Thermoanaerobaculia bacterium]|nr:hypothetical protein [Thermoanaerobaculia bacterium]
MSRWKRTAAVVLVLATALAVPAAAAERKPTRSLELAAITAQAWQRLTAPLEALWAATGGTMSADGAIDKGRGGMDPNGTPLPPPPPTSGTDGTTGYGRGSMDPDGQP